MDYKKLWEAAKEPLRLLVLAIVPVLLVYFEAISSEVAVVIVFVLRFVDKYLHNIAPEGKAGGLVRF